MEKSPWDSDFGSIFKQRYTRDMLDKYHRDIRKGPVEEGIGAAIGNTVAPGVGGAVGGAIAGNALSKPQEDKQSGDTDITAVPNKVPEAEEVAEAAPEAAALALSLRKARISLRKFLKKCDAPNAGLNIKNVRQNKGGVYPTKSKAKEKHIKG